MTYLLRHFHFRIMTFKQIDKISKKVSNKAPFLANHLRFEVLYGKDRSNSAT